MSQEWRLQAACRDTADPRAFGKSTEQFAFIAEFCRHCDVTRACFEFSVEVDSDGVFGGTTRRQRSTRGAVPKKNDRRPRELQPCGTRAAYTRHRRRSEEPCGPCRAAANAAQKKRVARELA